MSSFLTPTSKAVLGVIAIFIFGWLAGMLTTSVFIHHKVMVLSRGGPAALAQVVEKRLTRNISLDATQKQQIHEVFLDNLTQRVALQQQLQPQIQALNAETMNKIIAVLHPDQADKFKENVLYFKAHAGRSFLGAYTPDATTTPSK